MKFWKICFIILAVVAAPFLIQANLGCGELLVAGNPPETSFTNSYLCSCNCTTGMTHRQFQVSFGEDDAEQKLSDGSVDLTSPDLDMSASRIIGLRFRSINIPKDAVITGAGLQFGSTSAGTGPLMLTVKAQAADNAPVFTNAANNLSMRSTLAPSVNFNPPDWNADESGMNQLVDVKTLVQEIVKQMGWAEGNSLVLLVAPVSGSGARHAASKEGKAVRAPILTVDYQDPGTAVIGPQDLPVCMTEDFNPNLNGGIVPNDGLLKADCEVRVHDALTGLAEACGYPANCTCTFDATSRKFADKCDDDCVANPVESNCSDFDPVHGHVEATNAPGDAPVCLTNSPLTQGLYGRRTRCLVGGNAHVAIEDESKSPSANGILQFLGTPCPGGTCPVGIEYRLDFGSVTFESLFDSDTFNQLAGLGKSMPGHDAMLSMTGDGTFSPKSAEVSGRGNREGGDQLAFATLNDDIFNVKVKYGAVGPTCTLTGNIIGNVNPELKRCEPHGPTANKICTSDDDCEDDDACSDEKCNCEAISTSQLALSVNVSGDIKNQPPTADAGDDQTIECTDAAGTAITLDGTGSSDLDNNIKLFMWLRGSRTGAEVGIDPVSHVIQPPGGESYVLRVIDAFGQTDEDTTMVGVEDTIAPEVHCGVAKHVLEILNHNLVNVGLAASAQDQCEGTLPITVKVFGDENDEVNVGDGVYSPDAKNLAVGALRLRSERRNSGNGRVYLIVTEASDTSGNRGFDCCTVIVPRSPRLQTSLQSAEMQAAVARNFCLANDGAAPNGYFVIGDGPVIGLKQ